MKVHSFSHLFAKLVKPSFKRRFLTCCLCYLNGNGIKQVYILEIMLLLDDVVFNYALSRFLGLSNFFVVTVHKGSASEFEHVSWFTTSLVYLPCERAI